MKELCFGALALALVACDPIYTLGVRTRLAPAPPTDCLTAALRRAPSRSEVRPADGGDGFAYLFTLSDATAAAGWRDAKIRLEGGADSARFLSLTFVWLGTARSVPLAEQRRMLALGSGVLGELRAACAPAAPMEVECIARGLGGSEACRPAA